MCCVQVDNGTTEKFGTEIALRASFEKAVWKYDLEKQKTFAESLENLESGEEQLGWDGCRPSSWPEFCDTGRAICLCVEGGFGTIGTVLASIENKMPVLVLQGTGRASDLISDSLEIYSKLNSETSAIPAGRSGGSPRNEKMATPQWLRRRQLIEKVLQFPKAPLLLIDEHLKDGQELFDEYQLEAVLPKEKREALPSDKVQKFCNQLQSIAASRMCTTYALWHGAAGLDEAITRCVERSIEQEFVSSKSRTGLELYEQKLAYMAQRGQCAMVEEVLNELKILSAVEGLNSASRKGRESSLPVEREGSRGRETPMKGPICTGLDGSQALPRYEGWHHEVSLPIGMLNRLLHAALVHGQVAVAETALRHGASLDWYDPLLTTQNAEIRTFQSNSASITKEYAPAALPGTPVGVWAELLAGASDRLIGLLSQAGVVPKSSTNEQVLDILEETYRNIVKNVPRCSQRVRAGGFSFTRAQGTSGAWASEDVLLFFFFLLTNRAGLAALFFATCAHNSKDIAMHNALLASLLCRGLAAEVGKHSVGQKIEFEQIAAFYELKASSILRAAHQRSEAHALKALELPLTRSTASTSLDLAIDGCCRQLIAKNSDLCIEAIQRRFYGHGGLLSSIRRINAAFESFLPRQMVPCITAAASKYSALFLGIASIALYFLVPSALPVMWALISPWVIYWVLTRESITAALQCLQKAGYADLVICALIDLFGISYHVLLLLPSYFYILIWPPVCAVIVHALFKNPFFTFFAFMEECLPFVDFFPTATLSCLLQRQEDAHVARQQYSDDNNAEAFLSVDHFILDLLMHTIATYLLTTLLFISPNHSSTMVFLIELLIFVIFLFDELPDILFAGLEEEEEAASSAHDEPALLCADFGSEPSVKRSFRHVRSDPQQRPRWSLWKVFTAGFKIYSQDSRYRQHNT